MHLFNYYLIENFHYINSTNYFVSYRINHFKNDYRINKDERWNRGRISWKKFIPSHQSDRKFNSIIKIIELLGRTCSRRNFRAIIWAHDNLGLAERFHAQLRPTISRADTPRLSIHRWKFDNTRSPAVGSPQGSNASRNATTPQVVAKCLIPRTLKFSTHRLDYRGIKPFLPRRISLISLVSRFTFLVIFAKFLPIFFSVQRKEKRTGFFLPFFRAFMAKIFFRERAPHSRIPRQIRKRLRSRWWERIKYYGFQNVDP